MRTLVGGWVVALLATVFLPVVLAGGLVGAVAAGGGGAGGSGPGKVPGVPAAAPDIFGPGTVAGRGSVAVAWALAQLGRPYRWGATGPDAFDCSGLVLRAWQAAGVELPRVAADQYRVAGHVPVAAAGPGDLVFFSPDPADPASIEHVGIVVGPGIMVDAPHTGAVVRVTPFYPGLMPDAVRPG